MSTVTSEMKRQLSLRKIRAAMNRKGWEERDLAYHAKVSPPTIGELLRGESGGRVSTLLKIADALEVESLDDLLDEIR